MFLTYDFFGNLNSTFILILLGTSSLTVLAVQSLFHVLILFESINPVFLFACVRGSIQ